MMCCLCGHPGTIQPRLHSMHMQCTAETSQSESSRCFARDRHAALAPSRTASIGVHGSSNGCLHRLILIHRPGRLRCDPDVQKPIASVLPLSDKADLVHPWKRPWFLLSCVFLPKGQILVNPFARWELTCRQNSGIG